MAADKLMKKTFNEIWKLALPYQDKRGDEGHAKVVLNYAVKLIKLENADENVVVPAAILHDIGWSQLPKEERLSIFGNKISKEDKIKARKKHQEIGVKLAKEILKKENYNAQLVNEILEIISGHDTKEGFASKNEGIMRDADKLWRFSKKGFWIGVKRDKIFPEDLYKKLKDKISLPAFLYSESAKEIAKQEIEKREKEFGKKQIETFINLQPK